ncbi:MAG: Slp family lipoprotein [Pseudomonadota bacterium]|nr:Slp family lipoprotein [Pseudomonadota bacterium]
MRRSAILIPVAVLLVGGCAGSACRPPLGDASITPAVAAASEQYSGRQARWGGVLVATRNLKDRTELEVVGYPLDSCGRPLLDSAPVGRFVVVRPGYLETADFDAGRRITATGRIVGVREGSIGDAPYGFPLLESYNPHLWPADRYSGEVRRPWVNIGIGGGSGGVGGGVGVVF